jgi:hypothetical protein
MLTLGSLLGHSFGFLSGQWVLPFSQLYILLTVP